MKIKTSELEGAALDWAVATIDESVMAFYYLDQGAVSPLPNAFFYSSRWEIGGPLLKKKRIEIGPSPSGWFGLAPDGYMEFGPTALIAAMRAIVASELGDTVDVPEELLRHSYTSGLL